MEITSDSKFVKNLNNDLFSFIGSWGENLNSERFNDIALKEFELQYSNINEYKKFCLKRNIKPDKIINWQEIPAVPTDAFKHFDFFCFKKAEIKKSFITSGTSEAGNKGKSHFDEIGLQLMDSSIIKNAETYLFSDRVKTKLLIICPPIEVAPYMIMAYGMGKLKENFGLVGSEFLINKHGFDLDVFIKHLRESESSGIPVTILGASFTLANFFEYCKKKKLTFKLPANSRSMDAGGDKGRSRKISREEFLSYFPEILGIPSECSVNLLGMTELGSQFYDNSFQNKFLNKSLRRFKVNPPWTRTVVVDAEALTIVPKGKVGLLKHFDLTNKERIMAIQTDDVGKEVDGGFEILGRAKRVDTKGCSITIDEMVKRN